MYLDEQISHSAATDWLLEEARSSKLGQQWSSSMLFDMARTSRQIGLFAGSGGLYDKGQSAFERELCNSDNPRKSIGLARLAIQRGDLDMAQYFAQTLRESKLQIPVTQLITRYVDLWSGTFFRESTRPQTDVDEQYSRLVCGQKILILGPGPMTDFAREDYGDFKIARIVFYSHSGMSAGGNDPGKTDLAYSNGVNSVRLAGLPAPVLRNFMSQFSAHTGRLGATKNGILEGRGLVSRFLPAEPILLTGGSNMAQTMLLDILSFAPEEVFLKGITFYTGGQPYRHGQERQIYSHISQVKPAPLGELRYRLCSDIGGHSPQENRKLILNLWNAGRVNGDVLFEKSLSLSEGSYLRGLDSQYGVDRL